MFADCTNSVTSITLTTYLTVATLPQKNPHSYGNTKSCLFKIIVQIKKEKEEVME